MNMVRIAIHVYILYIGMACERCFFTVRVDVNDANNYYVTFNTQCKWIKFFVS